MHAQANHRVLEELGAQRIGEATTATPRVLVDLGPYPALLADDGAGETHVAGEVYAISNAAIDALDAFEGCPDLYRRERITLVSAADDARTLEAWTYVLAVVAPAHAVVITTGRYAGGGIVLKESAREADALDKPR